MKFVKWKTQIWTNLWLSMTIGGMIIANGCKSLSREPLPEITAWLASSDAKLFKCSEADSSNDVLGKDTFVQEVLYEKDGQLMDVFFVVINHQIQCVCPVEPENSTLLN